MAIVSSNDDQNILRTLESEFSSDVCVWNLLNWQQKKEVRHGAANFVPGIKWNLAFALLLLQCKIHVVSMEFDNCDDEYPAYDSVQPELK